MFLPVSGLSVVLVAQWAGEALTLFPLRHQLQSADELGLAWLTPLAGPLLITKRFGLSPVEVKEQLAHHAPYLLFSLLFTCTCFVPFLFLDLLYFEESQAVSAASHRQVRRPGKLGTV